MTLFLAMLLCFVDASAAELPEAVDLFLADAAAEGLPTAHLEVKAREGVAKGVPEHRIVQVLRGQAADLRRAALLLPGADPSIVGAAGAVLGRGGSEASVVLAGGLGPDVAPQALWNLHDLLAMGVSDGSARRLVADAAAAAAPRDAMRGLASSTAQFVAQGLPPDAAASATSAGMGRGSLSGSQPPPHAGGPGGRNGNGNGNGNGGGNR